jgi:GAF domain-containing protein
LAINLSPEEALKLAELAETVLRSRSLEDLAGHILPFLSQLFGSSAILLYLVEPHTTRGRLFQEGFSSKAIPALENLCAGQWQEIPVTPALQRVHPAFPETGLAPVMFIPLDHPEKRLGLLGLRLPDGQPLPEKSFTEKVLAFLAQTIEHLEEDGENERQIRHLNAYLSVSSMIAQQLDLHELLETILWCVIDVVAAEEASVLLLDEDKTNFRFYSVEGPAKETLQGASFPAHKGIAGSVLATQQSQLINDVEHDPRFYREIDSKSGSQTRNMMVIPLTAGEEKIGILNVLNKAGGGAFEEEERRLLESVAEEIAFAICNAKIFEVLVNSCCKQRQGETSCKGCKRPLGSWTPCVKYRQAADIPL